MPHTYDHSAVCKNEAITFMRVRLACGRRAMRVRRPSARFASASIVIVVIVCLYIANKYLLNEMERTIVPQRIGLECLILNIYEAEWLAGLTTVC